MGNEESYGTEEKAGKKPKQLNFILNGTCTTKILYFPVFTSDRKVVKVAILEETDLQAHNQDI